MPNWESSQQRPFNFQCRSKNTNSFHNIGTDILDFSGDGLNNNARSYVNRQIWAINPHLLQFSDPDKDGHRGRGEASQEREGQTSQAGEREEGRKEEGVSCFFIRLWIFSAKFFLLHFDTSILFFSRLSQHWTRMVILWRKRGGVGLQAKIWLKIIIMMNTFHHGD